MCGIAQKLQIESKRESNRECEDEYSPKEYMVALEG